MSEIIDLKAIQRAVKPGSFVFVTDNLSSLGIFIVSIIGGIPAEHLAVEKLLSVIGVVEIFEAAVAHALKPFYCLFVLEFAKHPVNRDAVKSAKLPVPSEHEEQRALVAWADLMANRFPQLRLLHAIPNGGHRA